MMMMIHFLVDIEWNLGRIETRESGTRRDLDAFLG